MSHTSKPTPPVNYGINDALRNAGYVCLPDLWVHKSDMDLIHRIAAQHTEAVQKIRTDTREAYKAQDLKERAWREHEKNRAS